MKIDCAKVLVTGSEGFIGRHLVRELISRNCAVWGIGRRRAFPYAQEHGLSYRYCSHDLHFPFAIEQWCLQDGIDIVFHLAGETEHDQIENNADAVDSARSVLSNVLALAEQAGARSFVFSSSGKVYGKIRFLPTSEVQFPRPRTNLGRMKLACERDIGRKSGKAKDRNFVCARLFNIYGPGQRSSFLIPALLRRITEARDLGGRSIHLGNLTTLRDYLYVTDAVDALIRLAEIPWGANPWTTGNFLVANVGSGKTASPLQIAVALDQMIDPRGGQAAVLESDSTYRRRETAVEVAYNDTLRQLDWTPKVSLRRGLELCVSNFKRGWQNETIRA